jgi:hypothetical protein
MRRQTQLAQVNPANLGHTSGTSWNKGIGSCAYSPSLPLRPITTHINLLVVGASRSGKGEMFCPHCRRTQLAFHPAELVIVVILQPVHQWFPSHISAVSSYQLLEVVNADVVRTAPKAC